MPPTPPVTDVVTPPEAADSSTRRVPFGLAVLATGLPMFMATLDNLVTEGKVRYLGHSNFSGWELADAAWTAQTTSRTPFISAQNHYSLLARASEREVLPAANRYDLGFFPFFPLKNGLLTGKFTREGGPAGSRIMETRQHIWADAPWDALEQYQRFCDQREITMLQATFGWLLAQPGVSSVITGASRPEQIEDNVKAATTQLSPEAIERIEEILA